MQPGEAQRAGHPPGMWATSDASHPPHAGTGLPPGAGSLGHHMLQRKPARGLQAEEMFQPRLREGVEGLGIPGKLSIRNAVKNIQEGRHSWTPSLEAASQQLCSKALFWEGQSRRDPERQRGLAVRLTLPPASQLNSEGHLSRGEDGGGKWGRAGRQAGVPGGCVGALLVEALVVSAGPLWAQTQVTPCSRGYPACCISISLATLATSLHPLILRTLISEARLPWGVGGI